MQPRDLAARLAAGEPVYLLDVRRVEENEYAALPNSVLVPLHELRTRLEEVKPPEGVPIVVYCHHGVRSQHAAMLLATSGYTNVWSLVGGIDAWSLTVDSSVPRY